MLSFPTTRGDDYEYYRSDSLDGYYYRAASRLIRDFQTLTTFGGLFYFTTFGRINRMGVLF